ncbi:putative spermidine/putrescine transport system ATP-binding protein [Microbacteriaceae bacterium SG_E_30_P1]|uniref:Spermidine/putrescine transport system ATP-binding protein n=1 Tax=Antiquaquibacter oligotrophicus TaxID=2880260 RepID=A0ABT6KK04_9MICO|nr:ABC transporter ATP-binding protein [Antiquaquibacter oligotrophicus]MDH6180329.1 putative spermidine/putrescine transport system ATP-binding protein [Antiquaquibacter oligotrophicus]UDF13925.1 ABC transporter ATP-binding protein [Antiquaquibacter oligotrophicus]
MTNTIPVATAIDLEPVSGARVELANVVKHYGPHRALNSINLAIEPGEFIALLGPSGCGKTTALRALSGLEGIDGGEILIDGEDVASVPTNRRDMGMVFQSYSLFPHMTVLENVQFGLRMRRVPAAERKGRAVEALDMVGLAQFGSRYAHQLSGGQQQRVALARALVTRPHVLLLDEPLSALDAKVRVQLRDEIRRIQTELGITTVFVTHDQEEALAVADRVAVMREGVIEQVGTPEELYAAPATPFVADFVGLSNRVAGIATDGTVSVQGVELDMLGAPIQNGEVTAFIRPENIRFADDGIPATVVSSSFLGSLRRTRVRLGDDTLLSVQHAVDVHPQIGDTVHLQLRPAPVSAVPR